MWTDSVKTFGTSLALHVVAVGLLALFAAGRVLSPIDSNPIEIEILPAVAPPPPVVVEPEPEPEPEPPIIPAVQRPAQVPKQTAVRKVERPRPFQETPAAGAITREAPPEVEAVAAPTAPMPEIAMESTVSGDGSGYLTTARGDGTLPVRGGPGVGRGGGPAGGTSGPLANQGARGVAVSADWEITALPDPLNDRDFEPDYPVAARREGREAVVVLSLAIDPEGRVAAVEVVDGPRGFGFIEAARAYARKLRFRPARAGDRPVAARIEWSVHFYVRN